MLKVMENQRKVSKIFMTPLLVVAANATIPQIVSSIPLFHLNAFMSTSFPPLAEAAAAPWPPPPKINLFPPPCLFE